MTSQLNFYRFIPVCNKSPLKLCSSCIKPIHTTSDNNAKYEWATTLLLTWTSPALNETTHWSFITYYTQD